MNGKICLDYDVEVENEIVKQGLLDAGRKEGRAEGQILANQNNAKKMKENGISLDLISKITGLTKSQINLL